MRIRLLALLAAVALPLYAFESWTLYQQEVGSVGADYWEIQRHRIQGTDAVPYYAPMARYVRAGSTLDVAGTPSVPLFSIATKFSVLCREGDRPFATFTADRYGFNNPDAIWDQPIDIVTLGDSFTVGACVASQDHSVGLVRNAFPRLANLGVSGSGPIMQIAILREFVQAIRPKLVVWFYDEHNDVFTYNARPEAADIAIEHAHPILGRYLSEPSFRQDVLANMQAFQSALARDVERSIDGIRKNTLIRNANAALRFLALTQTRHRLGIGTLSAAEEDVRLRLFRQAMPMMAAEAHAVGAKLVVVKLPSNGALCNQARDPLANEVEDIIRINADGYLDLEADMRAAVGSGKEAALFALNCGGHYSETGYRIVGQRTTDWLRQTLQGQ